MKRSYLFAMALASSLGLAASVVAQSPYQGNARYSSYGSGATSVYHQEAPDQDPAEGTSPSDVVTPPANVPPSQNAQPTAPVIAGQAQAGQVYQPAVSGNCDSGYAGFDSHHGSRILGGGSGRNVTAGVRALFFDREYEDSRLYGSNSIGGMLYSDDSEHSGLNGFETFVGIRNCNGWGFEAGYWGLYPSTADVTFAGAPFTTALTGLSALTLNGSLVDATYNTADTWRTYRTSDIHSLEFNFLRNGGSVNCGTTSLEWLAGFRYFQFDEAIRLNASNSTAPYPPTTNLDSDVENRLLGVQLGARAERCLTGKLSLALGCRFGVYNNEAQFRSSVNNGAGTFAIVNTGPYTGQVYAHDVTENEVATLGELDLGLNWQFAECWRANLGYRILGAGGVALAPDQIPYDFTNFPGIRDIDTSGSLFLHGAYVGLEHAF